MELKFKEDQEKLDQERRENKLCRSKQALADFSPNDKEELSAECKSDQLTWTREQAKLINCDRLYPGDSISSAQSQSVSC